MLDDLTGCNYTQKPKRREMAEKLPPLLFTLTILPFQVGERIRVILDCEDNTLAFEKNYEFLGEFESLYLLTTEDVQHGLNCPGRSAKFKVVGYQLSIWLNLIKFLTNINKIYPT